MEMPLEADDLHLRHYWQVLVRRRRFILGLVIVATLGTALFTLFQLNIYQSTVTLMPLVAAQGGFASGLGDLERALPMGLGALRGPVTPTDRLLAILKSRTLATEVTQSLDLLPLLFAKRWQAEKQQWRTSKPPTLQDAIRLLNTLVSITAGPVSGGAVALGRLPALVTITVSHADAVLAAAIANSYVDALQRALNNNAFSLAKKNRTFIADQLEKTRKDLAVAEETLRQFEQTYKIVALEAQTASAVRAIAEVEAAIREREVRLGVQQRLMTGANREVYLLQEEIRELRGQLAQLQYGEPTLTQTKGSKKPENQVQLSLDEAPEIKLRYARLQREALVQSRLFTFLAQQLEQAKIDEAHDETAFQVLDRAVPPERKSKPTRSTIVLLSLVTSTFVGIVLAFMREYLDPTVRTKDHVERQTGLTLLVTVPGTESVQHQGSGRVAVPEAGRPTTIASDTPVTQALRYLHTRLKRLKSEQPVQTVLLVGPGAGDAPPSLLVALAVAAASTGERTLLIDANVRQPALHSLLSCTLAPGLADVLADLNYWQQSIQSTTVDNLHVVAAGTVTPTTSAALESSAFDTLLAHYKERYDLILCAAPPVLGCIDAAVLSSKVDATCLVLTAGVSHVDALLEAKNVLAAVQANVVGAILTSRDS